jgi:hypothetical protein
MSPPDVLGLGADYQTAFVHFGAAAGVNLKPLATAAFGWPTEWEQQFVQARQDFPGVTYV